MSPSLAWVMWAYLWLWSSPAPGFVPQVSM